MVYIKSNQSINLYSADAQKVSNALSADASCSLQSPWSGLKPTSISENVKTSSLKLIVKTM